MGEVRRRAGDTWLEQPSQSAVSPFRAWRCQSRWRGIKRVLVIAPASVKYQWKTEIEKFIGLPVQVIDGLLPQRRRLYAAPVFFNLTSYELVLRDLEFMREMRPDLVILDKAERIRDWTTATARTAAPRIGDTCAP